MQMKEGMEFINNGWCHVTPNPVSKPNKFSMCDSVHIEIVLHHCLLSQRHHCLLSQRHHSLLSQTPLSPLTETLGRVSEAYVTRHI